MTALLLCLMAYQVTGQKLHEWFVEGTLWTILCDINILNVQWYGSLFKREIYPVADNADAHQYERFYLHADVWGLVESCVGPPCFCGTSHSWTDGNSENLAPGGILFGICADEHSFGGSLEHGPWSVEQTLQ